jgi:hypothetical protein
MADLTAATIGGGSSERVQRNPLWGSGPDSLDLSKILYTGTKSLTLFEMDFGAAVNAQVDPNEAITRCINIVQKYANIVIRGDLHSTNQVMAFAVEQVNSELNGAGAETLNWDGLGAETLVEQIEDEIIALGDLSGSGQINYTSVTCTVKTSFNFA